MAAFLSAVLVTLLAQAIPMPAKAAPPAQPAAPECPNERPDATSAAVTARLCKRNIQVTDATTETDQTFAKPDGTFEWKHAYSPQRIRRGEAWVAVDSTLKFDPDGSVVPAATKADLRFSGGGSGPLVTMTVGDRRIELDSPLGRLPRPTLKGNVATYAELLPGVDLEVTAATGGYSQIVVVKDRAAARNPLLARLEFGARLDGLSFRADQHGNVSVVDAAGAVVVRAARPRLWDDAAGRSDAPAKAGGRARTKPMDLEVGVDRVAVTPDREVLDDPDTVYPVRIDPSMGLELGAFAVVFNDDPWAVYYNANIDAQSGTWNGGGQRARSFFQMWPNMYWQGKQITNATFTIQETHSYSCSARPVEAWLTGGIDGSTSWNNQPSWTTLLDTVNAAKGADSGCPAGNLDFNVTGAIQQAAVNNWSSVTLGVKASSETDSVGWKRFNPDTATVSVTFNWYPYLSNQATSPSGPCTTGANRPLLNSLTPTLQVLVGDYEGSTVKARFEVWQTGGGSSIWTHETPMAPIGTVVSAAVPAGTLSEGGTYSWRAVADDGSVSSPDGTTLNGWSPWCEFTVDTTRPGSPFVASTLYPSTAVSDTWGHGGANQAGQFTLRASSAPATPAGAWVLNEGTGSAAADSSGNNHPLTLANNAGWSTGPAGPALALNGPRSTLLPTTGVTQSLSGRGGRCFDIRNASSANGAVVQLYDCHGGANQIWEPQPNGSWKNPGTGKCLDLADMVDMTNLRLWDCSGGANQVLERTPAGNLRNPSSGKCLDAAYYGVGNEANVIVFGCGSNWNQHWQPQAAGTIMSERWGQCIDVTNSGTANGTIIEGWDCNDGAAQLWVWQANHSLKNPNSNRCLDVVGSGTANGTPIQLYDCNGGAAQVWEPQSNGSLRNPNSGRCLDSGASISPNGNQLVISDCDPTSMGQRWADRFATAQATAASVGMDTSQSFSVSAWVRPNTVNGLWGTAVSRDATRTSPFGLGLDDAGKWSLWVHTADSDSSGVLRASSSTVAIANAWVQLTGVYDQPSASIRLYVNGVLAATTTAVPALYNATGPLVVGRYQWAGNPAGFFAGDVDDVRVYSRAVSAAEISGADTVGYRFQLDGDTAPTDVAAAGEATVSITPREDGKRTVTVWAKDRANNLSNPTTYVFNVGRAGLVAPMAGATVIKRMKLAVSADPLLTRVVYQYRRGPGGTEIDIPLANLHKQDGSGVASYPATLSTLGSYAIWDAADSLGASGGVVQVRAVLYLASGGTPEYTTQWVTTTVDANGDTGATAEVGPGSVNLLTGDYTLSSTDVDEFGLSVGRVASSRMPADGWLPQGQRLAPATQQVTANNPTQDAIAQKGAGWAGVGNRMAADYDADGRQDIIGTAGDNLYVWRGNSSADFTTVSPDGLGTGWSGWTPLQPADFDGDGKPDIAAVHPDGTNLYIFRNTSNGATLSRDSGTYVGGGWSAFADRLVVDYDGDGKADIIARNSGTLYIWRNTTIGTAFSYAAPVALGTWDGLFTPLLEPGDFDGDGKPDLAAFNMAGDQLQIHRNTSVPGNPAKAAAQTVAPPAAANWSSVSRWTVTVADFDGDAKRDLVGRDSATNELKVWRSTGTGFTFSFSPGLVLGSGYGGFGQFLTADWSGDAKPEASAWTSNNDQLWIARNTSAVDGLFGGGAAVKKVSDRGQGSTKNSLEITPQQADGDTFASVEGDTGAMRLGMQAGKRYRVTGWIFVPGATGLSPVHARGLRIVGFTMTGSTYTDVRSAPATRVDSWQEITLDLTVPTTATEAFVRLYNGFGNDATKKVYWDNLSLTEILAPFGPQWRGGVGGGPADSPYASISFPSADLAKVLTVTGDTLTFSKNVTTGEYFPQPGAEDLSLAKVDDTTYRLSSLDGTKVEFGLQGTSYPVTRTWTADGPATTTTRYLYDTTDKRALVSRVIAPTEDGVGDCTTTTPANGCEVLEYDYAPASTSPPAGLGDYPERVRSVKLWSYQDALAGETAVEVMHYAYDNQGRLREAWDPRVTPSLKAQYQYDGSNHVSQITPAGELPWKFDYGTIAADTGNDGRLHRVHRETLVQGSANTIDTAGGEIASRIVYQVPLTRAAGGPNDLDAAAITTWGQTDLPTDATAIFGPEDDPTVVQATSSTPGQNGYPHSVVHYLNASAQEVNTASPHPAGVAGASIDSAQFDQFGNTVWILQATNRLIALNQLPDNDGNAIADSTDILTALGLIGLTTAQRAQALASTSTYSLDGLDLLETVGPTVKLKLDSQVTDPDGAGPLTTLVAGTDVIGRAHTVNVYDEGNPGGPAHLLTTSTQGATLTTSGYPDVDTRVTKTGYDPQAGTVSGWDLKKPTKITTDAVPGGINAAARTEYDPAGRIITSWGIDANGSNDARTTRTIYYTAGANTADALCGGKPWWAGQPCVTKKAGSVTGHDSARMATELPVRRVTDYNRWGDPTIVVESVSGNMTATRTTTTTYTASGRVDKVRIESTGDGATEVAELQTQYSTTSGQVTITTMGGASVIRAYDLLGRLYTYTDADGATTTNEFDHYGKPAKVSDPTGYSTFTYNRTAEPRGLLTSVTDSVAGTFSAEYSPDGQLTRLHYPNGMTRLDTLDTNLKPSSRSYKRDSDSTVIYSEAVVDNSAGEIVQHTDTGGIQTYDHDNLGRLESVQDTDATSACTTRIYAYDNRTNRTHRTSYAPGSGGGCQATTVAAQDNHTYDTADRIQDTGYTYDAFGRITTLPGGLTNTFHANDLVASQTVGTNKQNWTLDPKHRFRAVTTSTLVNGTWVNATNKLNHYGDDSDEPRWIVEDTTLGSLTRMVSGPDGDLVATTAASGNIALQITNLHGDVVTTVDTLLVPSAFQRFDEFGVPAAGQADTRYGWLGGKQRSAEALGDVVLMGVRLYHPDSGRFLQPDPVDGGSATAYDYCNANPITCTDLDGQWPSWSSIKSGLNVVAKVASIASMIPGPIGTIAGVVSAVSYAATGNWKEAAWAAAGAAAALVGAGAAVKGVKVAVSAVRAAKTAKAAAPIQRTSRAAASCAVGNSFAPDTPVLMADGSQLPIAQIQAGDWVAAVNPMTGRSSAEPVLEVIEGQGTRHLVDIEFESDSANVLTATAAHPIWVVGRGWTDAESVRLGDRMVTSAGGVTSVSRATDRGQIADQTVYNLNVANVHTYIVGIDDGILVHNCSITLLGKWNGIGIRDPNALRNFAGKEGFNVLSRPTMGTGRWRWNVNKQFIDDALAGGGEIRLMHNPKFFRYAGGIYKKELQYLRKLGHTWSRSGSHWVVN